MTVRTQAVETERLFAPSQKDAVAGIQGNRFPPVFAKLVYLLDGMERTDNPIFPVLMALCRDGMREVLPGKKGPDQHPSTQDDSHDL